MPNHDSKPAASYPSINSQLPFTYVRPATLLVPEEFQTGRKMEWSQTRLCDALSLSRATFETLLKHLDSYFTSGPQNPQATGLTWINLNGDDDPRADVCRELGMIDFGFALVQKVLGLKGRRDAEGGEINTIGYLLYQVAMASEKRTLARSLRQRKAIAAQISEDRKMAERMQAEREKEVREEAPAEEADGEKEVREETPAKAEGEMNVQALAEMEINAQNTFAGAAVRDNQMTGLTETIEAIQNIRADIEDRTRARTWRLEEDDRNHLKVIDFTLERFKRLSDTNLKLELGHKILAHLEAFLGFLEAFKLTDK